MVRTTLTTTLALLFSTAAAAQDGSLILKETNRLGGLAVHVGCGEGKLIAALGANPRFVVQGLARTEQELQSARRHVQEKGLYGRVSVRVLEGKRLPYADRLVNVLIVQDARAVSARECQRVLAPLGRLYVLRSNRWEKSVKPWSSDIDEWTHHLHDASGDAVARDRVVGPPRHLQWTAGPRWARSHGWTPSVSAMVSARGRLFTICDETPTGADGTLPSRWRLIARDAFSGVLLWKRPLSSWGSAAISGVPDTGREVSVGRFTMPPDIGKRLVAVGDTVYVTLGAHEPVSALDAATGATLRVFADTRNADEMVVDEGRLIVAINPPDENRPAVTPKEETPAPPPGKTVCGFDAATGRRLWRRGPFVGIRASRGQDPFGRLELAAQARRAYLLTATHIECLAASSGETVWSIPRPAIPDTAVRKLGYAGMYEYLLTVLVVHDGVVLLAQPEPNTHHTYHTMPGTLYAFDAADGRLLWKHGYGGWGHCTQPDVFAIGDTVWTHVNAETEFGSVWGHGYRAKDPSQVDYRIQALDLRTGRPRTELPTRDIFNVGHHHRCYRNKSTERYLLSCRRGVEFVDLKTGENWQDHWVRSGCLLGYLPCNGMLYVTPHPCACYRDVLLTGFNALAPARSGDGDLQPVAQRLTRGPAFGAIDAAKETSEQDWPTYRHDNRRSGAVERDMGDELRLAWRVQVGSRLSAPIIAAGKLFIADVDAHTLHALDANSGRRLWSFTANGRIDSPPTYSRGRVVFGSTEGSVYCLRASDGAQAWSFTAAPWTDQVMVRDQLESAWPVHGSVLVRDGVCWFTAGRSTYLDGGIRLWALDLATGRVVHEETLYSPDPKTGKMAPVTSPNQMPGVLDDILSSDGTDLYVRHVRVTANGYQPQPHLFHNGGFLDDSWFNRTFWHYGRARTSGLMVVGEEDAFGVELYDSRSRETIFTPGAHAYRLVRQPLRPPAGGQRSKASAKARRLRGPKPVWEQRLAFRPTALARAGRRLMVAGIPDVVDDDDPYAAWEGRKGGLLSVHDSADGRCLGDLPLSAPPVFDGMAVARQGVYVALADGAVVCLGGG